MFLDERDEREISELVLEGRDGYIPQYTIELPLVKENNYFEFNVPIINLNSKYAPDDFALIMVWPSIDFQKKFIFQNCIFFW